MHGRFLLDTSFIVDLLAGSPHVVRTVGEAEEVSIPSVAVGELLYGALRSARRDENVRAVQEFASAVTVLPVDAETAGHYAWIKDRLRAKGRPLPENDIWVAAVARQHSLVVATLDAHFKEIDDVASIGL